MRMLKLSNFLQAKFNIFLYTIFGWSLVRFYMFILCKFYFLIKKEERKSIKKSIHDVMGGIEKEKELSGVARGVFSGIYSHYYEKIFAAFESRKKISKFLHNHTSCRDISVIKESLSKGKGAILITGHYGAIEYIPLLLAINGIEISMIAKFKTEKLRKMAFQQADRFGIRMIDGAEKGNVFKKAINELKQNRVLITQCDEIDEWRTSDRKKTTFLGQVTGLDRTINLLQKRSGAEAIFGVLHRFSLDRYKFLAYSREQMVNMIQTSPSTTGEIVLKVLEQFIYKFPEQWYEWKKYPELVRAYSTPYKEERRAAVSYLQPTFNINL